VEGRRLKLTGERLRKDKDHSKRLVLWLDNENRNPIKERSKPQEIGNKPPDSKRLIRERNSKRGRKPQRHGNGSKPPEQEKPLHERRSSQERKPQQQQQQDERSKPE